MRAAVGPTCKPATVDPVATATPMHLEAKPRLRGWSHAVAGLVAVALCPILVVFSAGTRSTAAIFASAIVGLFATSAVYHRFRWGRRTHAVLRRLDHAMIFIAIAATYTGVAASLPPGSGRLILTLVWAGAAAGVATQLLWPDAPRLLIVGLYIAVGWAALVVIDDIWRALGAGGFALLLAGGGLHTIGATVYARRRPDPWPTWFGFHEIFHLFVVAAVASHYVVVAFFALPRGAGA
jgi:hemolysin III